MISQTTLATSQNGHAVGPVGLALADLKNGVASWRIWLLLAWQDIRLRYRRSTLGPFWITLSMGITIGMTGLLYGSLFHFRLAEYFPAFASGMLVWSLISASISEGSNIFVDSESFLKQVKLPYSLFVFRTVTRNWIIFLHNIVIFVPIIFIFHLSINAHTLFVAVGLALVLYNAITVGMVLAILGTRYRDIAQVVNSLIQVIFFLTPIIWSPAMLPEKYQFAVRLNPVAQFLEIIRAPLMGQAPSHYAWSMVLFLSVITTALAFALFVRFRSRIAYWL